MRTPGGEHDADQEHHAPVTLWRTFLVLLWCAVFVFAAILIGEYTGLIDSARVQPGAAVHADQPGSKRARLGRADADAESAATRTGDAGRCRGPTFG